MSDDSNGDDTNNEAGAPDGADEAAGPDPDDLLVSEVGGLVMLLGSDAAIERFVAAEPALKGSRARQAGDLATLGSMLSGLELANVAPALFELDPLGRAMFDSGLLAKAKDAPGWFRGWGRSNTEIVRQAMIRPAGLPRVEGTVGSQAAVAV